MALAKFEAARQAGMDEPRLDFNLALCHLKLAHYDQAKDYFLSAARYKPLEGLVSFNIGLLELQRGQPEEARKWFANVRDNAVEAKLRELAGQRLVLLERASAIDEVAIWTNGYRVHTGYDDNIEDPTLIGTTDKGDNFTSAMVYGTYSQNGDSGINFGLIGFLQHYQSIQAYDLDLVQLFLDKGFVTGDWSNRFGGEMENTTLGGDPYLQTTKLYISGKLPLTVMDELRIRYRYSAIADLSQAYDYLAGNRQELEFRWQHKRPGIQLQAGYEFESNDRNDYTGTTIFSSYSPSRHTIDLRAEKNLNREWRVDGRINWRTSLYTKENILPDSSHIQRADDRLMLTFGVDYALSNSLDIGFEYKFTENHSNIDTYHYTRHIYTVSISGTF